MIEISWPSFFLLYLLTTLFLIFGLWLKNHRQQKGRKLELVQTHLQTCPFCHHTWPAKKGEKVVQCPLCRSYN